MGPIRKDLSCQKNIHLSSLREMTRLGQKLQKLKLTVECRINHRGRTRVMETSWQAVAIVWYGATCWGWNILNGLTLLVVPQPLHHLGPQQLSTSTHGQRLIILPFSRKAHLFRDAHLTPGLILMFPLSISRALCQETYHTGSSTCLSSPNCNLPKDGNHVFLFPGIQGITKNTVKIQ